MADDEQPASSPEGESTDEESTPPEVLLAEETAMEAPSEPAAPAEEPTEAEEPEADEPAPAVAAEAEPVEAEVEEDEEEEPAPREKPSVPGAHLEVDIVPEGVDPLGRSSGYEDVYAIDPYATEEDAEEEQGVEEEDREAVLSEPIATAAIDLASGARYRATGKRKIGDRAGDPAAGQRQLPRQRAHAGGALPAADAPAQHPPATGDGRLPGAHGRGRAAARRRHLRAGGGAAPRRLACPAGGRPEPAGRAQAQGLPDTRFAREGAQEGRPEEGAQAPAVLQAIEDPPRT